MSEKVREMKGPTAAIIVIGDEILKGQIQDANTFFLTKELKECGIKVTRGVIIPDNIDVIAHEVQDLCHRFTYVFTCGGVGPTHDDVTFEGIAKGFNEDLVTSPEIVEVLQMHFKDNINDSILKMAKVSDRNLFHLCISLKSPCENQYYICILFVYIIRSILHVHFIAYTMT